MIPRPASVRYNDWRQVDVPALEAFTPTMPVSVIAPAYQTPAETLARTLAALEGQTYPRELFEVVIVDDGSEPAMERPQSTTLDVKLVRQEHCGFGAPRARNTGVRAAAHDVVLFLDSDMLAEAGLDRGARPLAPRRFRRPDIGIPQPCGDGRHRRGDDPTPARVVAGAVFGPAGGPTLG